jgi:CDP-6-deoxy-D-xylo-4-hexulose-3-dehydrase
MTLFIINNRGTTMSQNIAVSYAKTVYGQKEIDAVVKCLNESTQMSKYAGAFEKKIATLFDKKYGVFVNSGSSALYIGMEAEGFPKGSEVITPALTFSTTVGCIVKSGLIPAFVDVGYNDYCIDVEKIEAMITDKTVAILAPNLLGNLCQWDKIADIAKRHNLRVIEDSADTLGATLHGRPSGAWTDWSITSFYGSHIINCAGNGGMLCLNDDEHLKQSKLLRSWGRSSSIFDEKSESIENRFNVDLDGIEYDAKFIFERIGYNLEGSEIGAAFGLTQLEDLENNIQTREKNFARQTAFFKNFEEFFVLPGQTEGARTPWLAYPVVIKQSAPFKRRDFQIYLEQRNIQTRTIFTGNITRQPGYKNLEMRKSKEGFSNADRIMQGGVLLACHHGLNQAMFDHMHSVIADFVREKTGKNLAKAS